MGPGGWQHAPTLLFPGNLIEHIVRAEVVGTWEAIPKIPVVLAPCLLVGLHGHLSQHYVGRSM